MTEDEVRSPERKRVDRIAREYGRAQKALDEFMAAHEPFMEQLSQLADERNVKLDRLKRAVRETGLSAGPLEVSVQRKRIINGQKLWRYYKDRRDLRKALVKREYKVDMKAFDQLVQAGEITADVAQDVVEEIKTTNRVLHAPPEMVLG